MIYKDNRMFNASFDDYASDYDNVRPSYPDQIFARIKELCNLSDNSDILEIGAGSGIATKKLVEATNSRVVALEPGENLLKVARQRLMTQKVDFVCDTFENYSAKSDQEFDAIAAFTSLHWLKKEKATSDISALLKKGGHLIVVWNSFFQKDNETTKAIDTLYRREIPDVYPNGSATASVNSGVMKKLDQRIAGLVSDASFRLKYHSYYITEHHYDSESYSKLLMTFPKIVTIEDGRRDAFLEKVSDIIKAHGNSLVVPVMTSLLILERREDLLEVIAS